MNEQEKKGPFAYVDKNLKDKPQMRRWRARMDDGKIKTVTKTHKTELPMVKEYDAKIKAIEDRIKSLEDQREARKITQSFYESERATALLDLSFMKKDRDTRKEMEFVGRQAEFLGYEPDLIERNRG